MAPPGGAFRGEVGGTPFLLHIMSRREGFHPKVVNFVFLLIKLVGLGFKHSPTDLEFRASDILTVCYCVISTAEPPERERATSPDKSIKTGTEQYLSVWSSLHNRKFFKITKLWYHIHCGFVWQDISFSFGSFISFPLGTVNVW